MSANTSEVRAQDREISAQVLALLYRLVEKDPSVIALAQTMLDKGGRPSVDQTSTDGIDVQLRPVHRALWAKLTRAGQTRKQIVRQTDYPDTNYARTALQFLCRHGFARKLRGNLYVRSDREPR